MQDDLLNATETAAAEAIMSALKGFEKEKAGRILSIVEMNATSQGVIPNERGYLYWGEPTPA